MDPTEDVRVVLFHNGLWRSTTLTGEQIQFVHPDLTGEHLLLEHIDDRWTNAPVS